MPIFTPLQCSSIKKTKYIMGIIKSTLGTIKGKIGDMKFAMNKGQNIVARQPTSYSDAKTPVQQKNRNKFLLAVKAASAINAALRIGFKNYTATQSANNIFVSKTLKQFLGNATLSVADFKNALVSLGNLANIAPTVKTFTPATGLVNLTYADNSNGVNAFASDNIIVCIYDTVLQKGATAVTSFTRNGGAAGIAVSFPSMIGSVATNTVVWYFTKQVGVPAVSASASI
jgi:hypothetical protein